MLLDFGGDRTSLSKGRLTTADEVPEKAAMWVELMLLM